MPRKASSYSKKKVTPYTRISKKKGKSYIKTVPPQKIDKFSMGGGNKDDLKYKLTLVSAEKCQIRDGALEACRQYINKQIEKKKKLVGNYFFEVVVFPHHIQRENKMLTGAGADRMQTGMQLAFGKSSGKSAIVRSGSDIFRLYLETPKAVSIVRKLLKQVRPKLPCKVKILEGHAKAKKKKK